MNDQKYYITLAGRPDLYFHYEIDSGKFTWVEDKSCHRDNCKHIFTMLELAEIIEVELYKPEEHLCGFTKSCFEARCGYEWINSLIELVPVEEVNE